jgi:hypothetical protein
MRLYRSVPLSIVAIVFIAASASAQNWGRPPVPRSGACFYEHADYHGQYFCARSGDDTSHVPGGANNQISSIRVFGSAEVIVYRDADFRGKSRRFDSDVKNLDKVGWNDRISSFRIGSRGGGNPGGGWGRPPVPQAGACFYENKDYRGQYFCARIGTSTSQVAYGANNQISSIRVFGGAEVIVFGEPGFNGASRRFGSDVKNLDGTGWNDRITSFRIETRGNWSGNGNWGR